jgi:DNA end-binding protein Ku
LIWQITSLSKSRGISSRENFEDRYEDALTELIQKKSQGLPIAKDRPRAQAQVIDLMAALRESVKGSARKEADAPAKPSPARSRKKKAG